MNTTKNSTSPTTTRSENATSTTTTSTSTRMIWHNLVEWIVQGGGMVHPSLELRHNDNDNKKDDDDDDDDDDTTRTMMMRGVYARQCIPQDQVLMRIPVSLCTSGQNWPVQYVVNTQQQQQEQQPRKVSPWLRCLAAYYQAQTTSTATTSTTTTTMTPYLQSLPTVYETVAAWSEHQVNVYLAGTCTQGGSAVAWHDNDDSSLSFLRRRYEQQIRPYLMACGIIPSGTKNDDDDDIDGDDDETKSATDGTTTMVAASASETELQAFVQATACLSTRAFHLQKTPPPPQQHDSNEPSTTYRNNKDKDNDYTGPFLIPAIDLLNHADRNDPACVTTLHRTADHDYFCIVAQRDIAANQEICHSYFGDNDNDDMRTTTTTTTTTASQCLQTFGFVPQSCIQRMARWNNGTPKSSSRYNNNNNNNNQDHAAHLVPPLTPALLRKVDVLETAWQIMESGLPTRLAARMQDMDDEVWTVTVDRTRTADFIADDLIVDYIQDDDNNNDTNISDEIVTTAVVAFLPKCAYREASQALLGADILDDFFLGNLACTALLRTITKKMETYTPITWKGQVYNDDAVLLRQLLNLHQPDNKNRNPTATLTLPRDVHQLRLVYALTIRLEEKVCLQALRKNVVERLARLEESVQEDSDCGDNDNEDMEEANKKQKTGE